MARHGASAAASTPGRVADVLTLLGRCPDRTIFLSILLVRVAFVVYMICCRRLTPFLTGMPSEKMTIFDTSSTDDPSDPFPEVTRWDVVHFYHIATHGYTHEANCVFFPFMPLMIRGSTYLIKGLVPLLGQIASVPICLCVANVSASAMAGVLLRRITTLTFVGKEGLAMQQRSPLGPVTFCRVLFGSAAQSGEEAAASPETCALERMLVRRWQQNAVGTTLDTMRLSLEDEDVTNETSSTALDKAHTERLLRRRWRFVGAAVLAWLMTPSMVFTVVLYTESPFALFTFSGIYHLIAPTAVEKAEMARMISATTVAGVRDGTADDDEKACDMVAPEVVVKSFVITDKQGRPVARLAQRYVPPVQDLIAVLMFFLTATIRSNGLVNVGFLWYPFVLQILWPAEYQWRWRLTYASLCQRVQHDAAKATKAAKDTSRCPTYRLATLPTRWPHPVRLLWLCIFTAMILFPSMAMNKLAFDRFYGFLTPSEKAVVAGRFWRMYTHIQSKHWNCGFLRAYTLKNSPNVLIALPVGSLVVSASVLICRSFGKGYPRGSSSSSSAQSRPASLVARVVCHLAQSLRFGLQSSNMTLLWALTLIGFTMMHINVVNRFIMACPALHWMFAYFWVRWPPQGHGLRQILARRKKGERGMALYGPTVSFVWVAYMLLWNVLGGYMFPNHLPWT